MRGKVHAQPNRKLWDGITPAYAGKRNHLPPIFLVFRDHPRLCGEKLPVGQMSPSKLGSPPPMRGKVWKWENFLRSTRITPAYAGKSDAAGTGFPGLQDHPRLCGEKLIDQQLIDQRLGSPPPMRGKETDGLFCDICSGITPAYAGKSFCTFSDGTIS